MVKFGIAALPPACFRCIIVDVSANILSAPSLPVMPKRPTIADVAARAGVSHMTVSRVINGATAVSENTRQRVMAAIDELGYRPSGIARSLATQRTRTLGVVVPDVSNPFFADIVLGVEHVAYAQNYNVFLCNTEEDPQRELSVLRSLEEKQVEGLIVCSSRLTDAELRQALQRHPATVLINRQLPAAEISAVMVDYERGARQLVELVLAAGRRRLAFLAGPVASQSRLWRESGYHKALAAAGMNPHEAWVQPCAPSVAGGQTAAQALLAAHPEIDTLLCYNDLVAVGALQAAAGLGRRVPDDVAVTGFDDITLAALVTPPLTTCRVPRYELGVQAMKLLWQHINGDTASPRTVIIPPEQVIRASAPSSPGNTPAFHPIF